MSVPEKKFLVAAGRPDERELVREALEEGGRFNVTLVDRGEDALALIQTGNRYFVIAAWELPGLGGLRLVKEYRNTPVGAEEPCLLIVPENPESELFMAEGAGVSGFLTRPLAKKEVLGEVERQLERNPEADWPAAREKKAEKLADAERPYEALVEYKRAIEAGRLRIASIQADAGITYLKMGRIDEAVDRLEQAAAIDPNLARAQAALGKAYLETGRPAEAERAFERAARLDPQNTEVQTALAESYLESGKPEAAERLYRKLLKHSPEDGFLLNRLGMAMRRQGRLDRAIAHYLEAIGIKPGDENLLFNLGRGYYESGDPGRAEAALTRCLEINPELVQAKKLLEKVRQETKGKSGLS
jgi:Tfp pilus assembly protein PilF/DNA-binding NarL/FixJ family response regulator